MLWRDLGGRTKEEHQELQDLDPKSSSHLEEKLTGGNVDLKLLSLFPQKVARSIGGIERSQAQEDVNNGGKMSSKNGPKLETKWGRRPLKREGRNLPVGGKNVKGRPSGRPGRGNGREGHIGKSGGPAMAGLAQP